MHLNAIFEVYIQGRIGQRNKGSITSRILDSIILIKIIHTPIKYKKICVFCFYLYICMKHYCTNNLN